MNGTYLLLSEAAFGLQLTLLLHRLLTIRDEHLTEQRTDTD
ncbi:hypothetical protein [Streptomyces griseoluteus]